VSLDKSVASGFCGLSVSCATGSLVSVGSLGFSVLAGSVGSADKDVGSDGAAEAVSVCVVAGDCVAV
jgi:hypothetical protein